MKKKAIKLATSTAIAASAFVAGAPVNKADAAVNVDQLVKAAEATAKVLQWSISTEGTADFVTRPYTEYNAAKAANKAAKAEVAKLKGADKAVYEARLLDSDLQIKRAQAYIDALTSGEKIVEKQANLQKAINATDLKNVQSSYHTLTAEIRKQAELLYRVYGQSTRDGILKKFKDPAEKLYRSVVNEVTVLDHVALVDKYTKEKAYDKAVDHVAKAEYALKDVKQFKTELTKNLNDVVDALPLMVTSVSRINSTTIEVKFTKALDSAPVSHFSFDKDVNVTTTKLSDDKKTVTLTVSGEKADTTYTLYYKGEATKSYTSPKAATGPITGPTDLVRQDAETTRTYTFNVDRRAGENYSGSVTIELVDPNDSTATPAAEIYTVNGSTDGVATGKVKWEGYARDGKVSLIIKGTSITDTKDVQPIVTKGATGDVQKGGITKFLVESDSKHYVTTNALERDNQGVVVQYVDAANDYFTATEPGTGNPELKFKMNKSAIYQVEGIIVSLDEFKKQLSTHDGLDIDYYKGSDGAKSVFNITQNLNVNSLTVTNPAKGVVRVSDKDFNFRGTGSSGNTVRIFVPKDATEYANNEATRQIAAFTISGSSWNKTVDLNKAQLNKFKVVQYYQDSNTPVPGNPTDLYEIKEGAFAFTEVKSSATAGEALKPGSTLTFTFGSDADAADGTFYWKDKATVANNAKLVLADANGVRATYTISSSDIKDNKTNEVTITLGSPDSTTGKYDSASGLEVVSFSGVTNQDSMPLDATKLSKALKVIKN
ncbi:hypothetical protein KDN24_14305 [Bacillus sp. Bva_UNVM-123]|uniref:hypothetical protein n=1 Tax=Bacillus sp. Bva_UNVM-123 TaxID=2829798 RepID=UPI00391F756E